MEQKQLPRGQIYGRGHLSRRQTHDLPTAEVGVKIPIHTAMAVRWISRRIFNQIMSRPGMCPTVAKDQRASTPPKGGKSINRSDQ